MKQEMNLGLALTPIIGLIIAASLSVFVWEAGMHLPLMIGVVIAAIIAYISGYKWEEIQEMMVRGVSRALPAIFILLIIGMIVGSWIASGVIPTIIYYGLSFIKPEIFIPLVALITGIVSITLGSSFVSIATVGIAFMAIGEGLGFSGGIIAGAVISGAFFGDKLSPLSDTTNIAPAMAETDLFTHIRHMLWDTIPAFLIALILYGVISIKTAGNHTISSQEITNIQAGLDKLFNIHPSLLLLPILTIILMIRKTPAIPTLVFITFLGALLAVLFQGQGVSSLMQAMTTGFSGRSGIDSVDALLNAGGLMSMLSTIGLLIIATALGGILEDSGAFELITRKIMAKIKSTGSLISATIFSTLGLAFTTGEQMISIILPARSFVHKYREMGIDTKNLSRCVEAAGTVGINLVPWGVTAVYAQTMLGVNPLDFIPYAFFVILVPIINLIFGYTGWTITRKNP